MAQTRVEEGQSYDGGKDHGPLKDHEERLIVGERAVEAFLKLSNAIAAPDEDGHSSECKTEQESLVEEALSNTFVCRIGRFGAANDRPGEHDTRDHKKKEREDLKHQTGNHDVDASIAVAVRVGRRCQSTPDGLQQKGDKIAGDKDDSVGARSKV